MECKFGIMYTSQCWKFTVLVERIKAGMSEEWNLNLGSHTTDSLDSFCSSLCLWEIKYTSVFQKLFELKSVVQTTNYPSL